MTLGSDKRERDGGVARFFRQINLVDVKRKPSNTYSLHQRYQGKWFIDYSILISHRIRSLKEHITRVYRAGRGMIFMSLLCDLNNSNSGEKVKKKQEVN
jgi:hypothetical protein